MTTDQLRELRARITPGPWETHRGNSMIRKCEEGVCQAIADMRPPYKRGIGLVRGEQSQWANAQAIALVPQLLDRIIACEEANADLETIIAACAGKFAEYADRDMADMCLAALKDRTNHG